MKKFNLSRLVISLSIPLLVEIISGCITMASIDPWYIQLKRPSFNPPTWLFAPVWTVLYILMGISFYIIWQNVTTAEQKLRVFFIFGLQLFLNFWWSIIFFYFHEAAFALVDIIALWTFILWMILLFKQIKPLAAYLQIPYLLWVLYAMMLNYQIWALN